MLGYHRKVILKIFRVYGPNTHHYAEMLIDAAKIESEFQEFKQS